MVTHDHALLATDRRLTFTSGPQAGHVADDDACKLVSLCNVVGIAYTGLASIGGTPTHEWIAERLAESSCTSPAHAGEILRLCAAAELPATRYAGEQTFLFAGWDVHPDEGRLTPRLGLVTNKYDASGQVRGFPSYEFSHYFNWLTGDRRWTAKLAGHDMSDQKVRHLRRLYNRLADGQVSPRLVLREMAQAIADTAARAPGVGSKVLCMCISRAGAEKALAGGASMLVATTDAVEGASFRYYDPGSDALKQYGPTVVCGQSAYTDLVTEDDPSRDYQSVQIKILHIPPEP